MEIQEAQNAIKHNSQLIRSKYLGFRFAAVRLPGGKFLSFPLIS